MKMRNRSGRVGGLGVRARWERGAEALERRVMLSAAVAAFAPQVTLSVGAQPRGVVTADLNGDGKLDLVVTNGAAGTVGVLLGNGNGTFGGQATFGVGANPYGVAVGDLNRDGKLDLVVANDGSGNVSVLLGVGDGSFGAQQTFATGGQARWVAVTELNGDGKPDLVVVNYGAYSGSLLVGNGDGTFGGQQTFFTGTGAMSVGVGDFNRDGKPDVTFTNRQVGLVYTALGAGNGKLGTVAGNLAGSQPVSVAVGDVNRDGRADLVVAEGGGVVGVLAGNGNGSFGSQYTIAAGANLSSVAVVDVNGDGKLDVVVTNYGSGTVGVLLGNGDGSFAGAKTFGVGANPVSVAAVDLNRDGRVDLVTANAGDGTVGVLVADTPPTVVSINRTDPSGQKGTSISYAVTFSEAVTGVDSTDFAVALGGGVTAATPVVVSGSGASYQVTVNGISGNGTLGLNLVDDGSIRNAAGNPLRPGMQAALGVPQTIATLTPASAIASGDVNGDGNLDLVLAEGGSAPNVAVLLGNGNGTFKAPKSFSLPVSSQICVLADVTADGKLDLIVGAGAIGGVAVYPGNGDGTFAPRTTNWVFAPNSLVVSDVNMDGIPDLVYSSDSAGYELLLLGKPGGGFQTGQTFANVTFGRSQAIVDLNRDGKPDVLSGYGPSTILGNGNGTFADRRTLIYPSLNTPVAVADLNGDGNVDVAAGSFYNGADMATVLLGDGQGGLLNKWTSPFLGTLASSIGVTDLNGDGKPDMVVGCAGDVLGNSSGVYVLMGNGDGTFAAPATFADAMKPVGMTSGDFNGDGVPDVAVANLGASVVSVFLAASDGSFTGQTYSGPKVVSFTRLLGGATTGASSVTFRVTFSEVVTGVDAADFRVVTTGDVVAGQVTAGASNGTSWNVTVSGIHGTGDLRLDLVDNSSVAGTAGVLGGPAGNGSFYGPTFTILQTFPSVVSIARTSPPGPITSASSVTYTVKFSEPMWVYATDFALALDGVTATTPLMVKAVVDGYPATYSVTVNGVSGAGSMSLELVDDGTIRNVARNPLQTGNISTLSPAMTFATDAGASWETTTDLNGDGKRDVVVSGPGLSRVGVLLGNGNGTFAAQQTVALAAAGRVLAGDVNGDGIVDLVVKSYDSTAGVLLGNGDGTFGAEQTFFTGAASYFGDALADVNADGRLDLVLGDPSGRVVMLTGNGDGTFGAGRTFAAGPQPVGVAAGDFNGDGKLDLVVANGGAGVHQVRLLTGNGDGTFAAGRTIDIGVTANDVTVADVNGDGLADLVVPGSGGTAVLLGNGNGTFGGAVMGLAGVSAPRVDVADVNGDGKFDLVSGLGWAAGNGDGTFGPAHTYSGGGAYVSAMDMNGDGKVDVVAVGGQGVSVMLGNGDFMGPAYTVVPYATTVNGTGAVDAITLAQDPDHVHVDWTVGTTTGQMSVNDVNGLTINGNGGSDVITLDYTNGNPLPNVVHLNGTFTINGLASGANPLAGTTLEIGRSTVWVNYSGASPVAAIRAALAAGYNGGGWNGSSAGGVITSGAAAGNASQNTGIGWADSGDGSGVNTVTNSIELKYTLNGDANLNGVVDIFDLNALLPHFNGAGDWTGGDSNYSGGVDIFDLNALLPNFNTSLGSQVMAAGANGAGATFSASVVTAEAVNAVVGQSGVAGPVGGGDGATVEMLRKKRHSRR